MSLPSADLSVRRVQMRVGHGGHDVPEEIIRRRYEEGLCNFFRRYRDLVSRWYLYDNEEGLPRLIATGAEDERVRIDDLPKWSTLEERYG